mgnify:CR=1 FL=1
MASRTGIDFSRRRLLWGATAGAGGIALAAILYRLRAHKLRDEIREFQRESPYGLPRPTADRTTGLQLLMLPPDFSFRPVIRIGALPEAQIFLPNRWPGDTGHNAFLFLEGREFSDFELELEFRLTGHASANSGVQIRSQPHGATVCCCEDAAAALVGEAAHVAELELALGLLHREWFGI